MPFRNTDWLNIKKNKGKARDLHSRIGEVIFYVWDPIDVSGIPAASSEYRSYTMTIPQYVLDEKLKKIAS